MNVLLIDRTLKPSPEESNTEALAEVVAKALREEGVRALEAKPIPAPPSG